MQNRQKQKKKKKMNRVQLANDGWLRKKGSVKQRQFERPKVNGSESDVLMERRNRAKHHFLKWIRSQSKQNEPEKGTAKKKKMNDNTNNNKIWWSKINKNRNHKKNGKSKILDYDASSKCEWKRRAIDKDLPSMKTLAKTLILRKWTDWMQRPANAEPPNYLQQHEEREMKWYKSQFKFAANVWSQIMGKKNNG